MPQDLKASAPKMPKGRFPHRRTIEYLSSLPVYLKDSVKAVAVYYNTEEKGSSGARQVSDRPADHSWTSLGVQLAVVGPHSGNTEQKGWVLRLTLLRHRPLYVFSIHACAGIS